MKYACVVLLFPSVVGAQDAARDTTMKLSFGGFADGYYAWDFGRPPTFDRSFATARLRRRGLGGRRGDERDDCHDGGRHGGGTKTVLRHHVGPLLVAVRCTAGKEPDGPSRADEGQ